MEYNWEEVAVTATERDGFTCKVYTFRLLKASDDIDVEKAVRVACTEYCSTPEGRAVYEGNCDNFNWGDFDAYVGNDICERHGIRKVDSSIESISVDFDEALIFEDEIYPELVSHGEASYYTADVVSFDENNVPNTEKTICIKTRYVPTEKTFISILEDNMIYYMDCDEEIRNICEIEEEDAVEEFGGNIIEV